jgi:hypothetical protein
LQVAGSAENANEILESWQGSHLENARRSTFLDWFPFIPIYVVVLLLGVASGSAAFVRRGSPRRAAVGLLLGWAVVAAGILDATENLFLLCMIDARMAGYAVAGPACPLGSALFAWPKIGIMGMAIVYLGVTVVAWPWRGNYSLPAPGSLASRK